MNRFTRWPKVIPLEDIDANIVNWVARLGSPLRITLDQERQFEWQLFIKLNEIIGSKHIKTTATHPAANGFVQRLHRQLKAGFKCLLGIRAAWREDLSASTAELVYGEILRLPGEFPRSRGTSSDNLAPEDFTNELRQCFFVLEDYITCFCET